MRTFRARRWTRVWDFAADGATLWAGHVEGEAVSHQILDIATRDKHQTVFPTEVDALFEWDYGVHNPSLSSLYEKAKRDQWNGATDLDWDCEVDKTRDILDVRLTPIYGTSLWDSLSDSGKEELGYKSAMWRLSQFLHGEQGALLVSAELVDVVPDLDQKLCASAQVMDEARHVEVFRRYIKKVDRIYPIDATLRDLLQATLQSDMWQKKFIGMQVVIEGLALAAFKMMIRVTHDPLLKDLLIHVMRDESRHVGFGYLALRDSFVDLTERERREMEDFAFMACSAMVTKKNAQGEWVDGFLSINDVYREVGIDPDDMVEVWQGSDEDMNFNKFLFTDTIIPALSHLGLFTDKIRREYEGLGIIGADDAVQPISEDVTLN